VALRLGMMVFKAISLSSSTNGTRRRMRVDARIY
jgi:hypothetical protein